MAKARLANLIEIEGKIPIELKALDGAVEQRLRTSAQREAAVAGLAAVHAKFQDALAPLVDDAGFDLVTASEDMTAKSKEAVTGLVEGGVNALQALLTLRADGNLAAGLLFEAAHVDDPALIQPHPRAVLGGSRGDRAKSREIAPIAGKRTAARIERGADCPRRRR